MKINAEQLLKFVVQHIINAGGQDTHEYLLEITAIKFKLNMESSCKLIDMLERNEYIEIRGEDYASYNVNVVFITKKACDQIRTYNARKESKQCQA